MTDVVPSARCLNTALPQSLFSIVFTNVTGVGALIERAWVQ